MLIAKVFVHCILCESRVQAQHGWRVGTLATAACRGQCPHCPLPFESL